MSESVRSFELHRQNVSSVKPLLMWEDPLRTGLTLFELLVVMLMFQNSDFLRLVLRLVYFCLGATLFLELVTKFLSGGQTGLVSTFRPSRTFLHTVSRDQIQSRSNTIAAVLEEAVYWFKRAFDARDTTFTLSAFIAIWVFYISSYVVPVSTLFMLCLIGAFTLPVLTLRLEAQIAMARAYGYGLAQPHIDTFNSKMDNAHPYVKYVYGGISNQLGGGGGGGGPGPAAPATAAAAAAAAEVASVRAPSMRAPSARAPSVHSVAASHRSVPLSKAGSIRSAAPPSPAMSAHSHGLPPMAHEIPMQPTPAVPHAVPEGGPPGMTPEMYQAQMQHQAMMHHQAMMAQGGHPPYEGSVYSGYTGSYTDSMGGGSYVSRRSHAGHA